MAEGDRARLAAVLAADTELELGLDAAAALDRDLHQLADTLGVEHLERVALEDAVLEVEGEELALGVVAREPDRRLREVVRAERAEVRDLARSRRRARTRGEARSSSRTGTRLRAPPRHPLGQLAQPPQLLAEADEWVHDLDQRRPPGPLLHRAQRPDDRPHLHLVDLRVAAARAGNRACPSIGFDSCNCADPRPHRARRSPPRARAGTRAAADRAAGSSPAAPPSPRRCPRNRPAAPATAGRAQRAAPPRSSARIISCTTGSRSGAMNMCSVRHSPIPSAPNSRAFAASSGVSAFARTRSRRSSSAQPRIVPKFSSIAGGTRRTGPMITRPLPPSIVITSPTRNSCAPIVTVPAASSILSSPHPATHGLPIPRATTAACEVMPP